MSALLVVAGLALILCIIAYAMGRSDEERADDHSDGDAA